MNFGDTRIPDRIWRKLVPTNGCWRWTGTKNQDGYGRVKWQGKLWQIHRLVYSFHGAFFSHYDADHLCRVRDCANPKHIEFVPHAENVRRGNGGQNWASKTHCPQGHPYSGDNLFIGKRFGERRCRECQRTQGREAYARRKQNAL